MFYSTQKDKSEPLVPIVFKLEHKMLRECELSIKDTGFKLTFTTVTYDRGMNTITFAYNSLPVATFEIDDIGHENMSKVLDFMKKVSQTIVYRASFK